ncbi:MAG: arginase [Spirochaetales bacterium]|nr:arginase [Spirochaetales bacterium]
MDTFFRDLGVIGFLQDIGASKRGVDMGSYAIRAEHLIENLRGLGYQVTDEGNVEGLTMADAVEESAGVLKYLTPITKNMYLLKKEVEAIVDRGAFPIILGGDHSMAMGSLAGLQKKYQGNLGLLWVDAHGDFNIPETTPSGNIHGMPLAVITGRGEKTLLDIGPFPGVREENTVLFGIRDLDAEERRLLTESRARVFTTRDILEKGFFPCLQQALAIVTEGVEYFHLSFDMDSIDPLYAPGTGTPVMGGLTEREVLYLMERVHETGRLVSLDLVEVNPALDVGNKTARLAAELILRAMGKRLV